MTVENFKKYFGFYIDLLAIAWDIAWYIVLIIFCFGLKKSPQNKVAINNNKRVSSWFLCGRIQGSVG